MGYGILGGKKSGIWDIGGLKILDMGYRHPCVDLREDLSMGITGGGGGGGRCVGDTSVCEYVCWR